MLLNPPLQPPHLYRSFSKTLWLAPHHSVPRGFVALCPPPIWGQGHPGEVGDLMFGLKSAVDPSLPTREEKPNLCVFNCYCKSLRYLTSRWCTMYFTRL